MRSITCLECGLTSYNLRDIVEAWCGNCNKKIPWTVKGLWDAADLPNKAFERMADGGWWRISEPPGPIFPRSNRFEIYSQTIRVAQYRFSIEVSPGLIAVMGTWEGTIDWELVGHAGYGD